MPTGIHVSFELFSFNKVIIVCIVYYVVAFSVDAVIKIASLKLKIGSSSWLDQIVDCFYVNGKPGWGDADTLETRPKPSILDYILHVATFPWKV